MNQITQQNASASEELAATAEQMTAQAEQLQNLMSFFKIAGNDAMFSRRAAKAPLWSDKTQSGKAKPVAPTGRVAGDYDLSKFESF